MLRISRLTLVLILALLAQPVAAECYADYKAKQDSPLRLQYGVIQLDGGACKNKGRARDVIAQRIGRDGWKLLNVLSIFGPEGLDQRRASAGPYFLRY